MGLRTARWVLTGQVLKAADYVSGSVTQTTEFFFSHKVEQRWRCSETGLCLKSTFKEIIFS
jgi:hypothetical protein